MKYLWMMLAAFILMLTGCGQQSAAPAAGEYHSLAAQEAKARIDSGDPVKIVDVRTEEEYTQAHIDGAILIPVDTIGDEAPAALPDKNAEILVYCRSGNRSRTATEALAKLGYTKVYDFGGIIDWPYETVSGAPKATGVLSDFSANDLDGNAVDASVLAGHKLTMVNVWATYCQPCTQEMPALGEINQEYAAQGLQVIGIVSDAIDFGSGVPEDTINTAAWIVSKTKADYLHLLPSDDLNRTILNSVSAVPLTLFVDENGVQVGDAYVGARDKAQWTAIIDELLPKVE